MRGPRGAAASPRPLPTELRICVVGAGIGGASAALHLRQGLPRALGVDRLEDLPPGAVAVDILEASDRVGGRVRQASFPRREGQPQTEKEVAMKATGGRPPEDAVHYECGASIVSELNETVVGFARAVQEERRRSESDGGLGLAEAWRRTWAALKRRLFGIPPPVETTHKGDPVPFAIRANFSHWAFRACPGVRRALFDALPLTYRLRFAEVVTTAALLRKYGFWNLRKLEAVVKKTRGEGAVGLDFRPLYAALDAGEGFPTVDALLRHTCGPGATLWDRAISLLRRGHGSVAIEAAAARLGALVARPARDVIFADFPASADPLVRELVGANMRCNYGGQGLGDLHGYVGVVSVAGGIASKCFGISGGNVGVVRGVLDMAVGGSAGGRSCVRLRMNTAVTSVRLDPASRKYVVRTRNLSDPAMGACGAEAEALYDIVIFAAPLQATADRLASSRANRTNGVDLFDAATIPQFRDFCDRGAGNFPTKRRCVATLIEGRMRQAYWRRLADDRPGSKEEGSLPLCSVITQESTIPGGADPVEVDIYSCSLLLPTHLKTKADARAWQKYVLEDDPHAAVYKVFSKDILDREQIERMFEVGPGAHAVQTFDWLAYPTYATARTAAGDLSNFFFPFLVQENGPPVAGAETAQSRSFGSMLLYANAIENAASALEMSAIGGKNVANLAIDFVKRRRISVEPGSAEIKKLN